MLDETASKTVHKEMINIGKGSKTLNEVKPVEIINKNLGSFLTMSPVYKEIPVFHKLQDHAYE